MKSQVNSTGARPRWSILSWSLGMLLILNGGGPAPAQTSSISRMRPSMPVRADQVPGFPVKERYKAWRRELEFRQRPKPGPEPIRAVDQALAESVLLDESFDGATFPPAGWSSRLVAGTPAWIRSMGSPRTGTYGAYSEFGADTTLAKKYLITKRLSVNGALIYHLTFWMRRGFVEQFGSDSVYIRMSTTDSLPGSFTTTLFKCSDSPNDTSTDPHIYTTTYKQFLVTFTGTSGTIWLAFDHEDRSGQSIDLDDVQLEEIVNNDIAAVSVDEPASGARKALGAAFQPKGAFVNNGIVTQTGIPVRFRIYNAGGAAVYDDSKTIASLARDASAQVTFSSFTPSTPGNYVARIIAQNPGDTSPSNDSTDVPFRVRDNISGVKTVGPGGDFTTLTDAIRYLNDNNVAGPLTFSLTGTSFAEGPVSVDPISYTTSTQPVVVQPASGNSAAVSFWPTPVAPYGFRINGGASFTMNGSNNNSSTRNLTFSVDTSGFFAPAILLTNGCRNVTLKNMVVHGYSKSDGTANYAVALDTTLANRRDTNLVFDNMQINRGIDGLFLRGPSAKSFKIKVTNCDIGGTGADAVSQAGIDASNIDSLTIQNTGIHDLSRTFGIYDLFGIFLGEKCTNARISGNRIYALHHHVNSHFAQGLVTFAGSGSNLLCFNNFIYDIRSSGGGANPNVSLGMYCIPGNTGDRFYYNSINLSGNDSSGSAESFSTGIWIDDGAASFQVADNIVSNSMTFGGTSVGNKAYCMNVPSGGWPPGSASNRNDLFPSGAQGAVGFFNSLNLITLANWQTNTGQDANSISSNPLFVSNADLHIQTAGSSPVNAKAGPIAGITQDIDGDSRHTSTPDIGADEFTPASGIVGSVLTGWNMISLPVHVADSSLGSVFPSGRVSQAFAYSAGYVVRSNVTPGTGYWMKFSTPQTVAVGGPARERDTLDLAAGWNLIGSLSATIPYGIVTSLSPATILSRFFAYNQGYQVTDSLRPWQSYWVKLSQAGRVVLAKTGAAVEAASALRKDVPEVINQLSRLAFQDASSAEQSLYLGSDESLDPQTFELPPAPPEGVFDARYSSGRMLEIVTPGNTKVVRVLLTSARYPVKLKWNMHTHGIRAILSLDGRIVHLQGKGAVEINQPPASGVVLNLEAGSATPLEFALGQNYPNPFNPSTVIRYDLPVESNVVLKVYNVLGQEVATLVDGVQEAGFKSVRVDGGNLPSGIYFYRIATASFTAERKMVLLR